MKVSLIDYTGSGHEDPADYAATVLIFTKSTRLEMKPGLFDEISNWDSARKLAELKYMANTIPSSWEFVDYTFMVEDVTRAFTHQFVRSRQFSFAQQTMRVLNVSGWKYGTGPSIEIGQWDEATEEEKKAYEIWAEEMENIAKAYDRLIELGVPVEDARGLLPTNIFTNIVAKCNMRTFVELVRKRSSPRTQDEYRRVLDAMKDEVRKVHPWITLFVERDFDRAANDLCNEIKVLSETGLSKDVATRLIKYVDQMRGQS
jgi:flavin-dependent thymidylate synthase